MSGLGRRFLKSRGKNWSSYIAKKISGYRITPNQISVLSLISSFFAALCFYWTTRCYYFWLGAIFFIQFRLLCNMLDGMVAIEGGKKSQLGDIYNDLPDRLADVVIIISFGFTALHHNIFWMLNSADLTWLAALLALFTAYIRTLFTCVNAPADYSGPMAKQHRMALISLACFLCFVAAIFNFTLIGLVINYTLLVLNIGLVITVIRRIKHGVKYLLLNPNIS